jgi:release factor glutamine methyltransferase
MPESVGNHLPMRLLRLPGVYRPQEDTWFLVDELRRLRIHPADRVLDVGTGTGALALAAAFAGACDVTAIDICARAVASARLNAALHGAPLRVRRTTLASLPLEESFDLVIANPPYVPAPPPRRRGTHSRARAWDAGADGRSVLDPLCTRAATLVAPGGQLLMVHSALCDPARTIEALRRSGLAASVVARRSIPFGEVLTARRSWLVDNGLLGARDESEEIVVIHATRQGVLDRAA